MTFRIDNLKFLILLMFAFFVFVIYRESMIEFFDQIKLIGTGDSPKEELKGLIPFTILAITFAGLIRMFIQPTGKDE